MRRLSLFTLLSVLVVISCGDNSVGSKDNNEDKESSNSNYIVTIDINPSEAGSVNPNSVDVYDSGEIVELQANPNDGYVFSDWSGDIESTDNPYSLTVDKDYNINANFQIKSYELNIKTEGEGTVSERIVQQKSTDYEYGTVVELTAEPKNGYQFVEWQDDLNGNENPIEITIDNPQNITAVFDIATYPITIGIKGEGSVTLTPNKEEYQYGTEVELLALPKNTDWEFESFSGDTITTANPIVVTVDSSLSISSNFSNTLFEGGIGTGENPYKISTVEQLQNMDRYPNAYYVQTDNISARDTEFWNNGLGFRPIGDEIIPFTGSYDGQNFAIIDLFIDRNDKNIGLFGYGEGAIINRLSLNAVKVYGGHDSFAIGGLLGFCLNSCVVSDVNVDGDIDVNNTGLSFVGMIFGIISSNIDNIPNQLINLNANSTINVQGDAYIGAIGGSFVDGTIQDSESQGDIVSSGSGGGLFGGGTRVLINESFSSVSVSSSISGGLVGVFEGGIESSYSTGDIVGVENTGGLVGRMRTIYTDDVDLYINNSFSTGKIVGKNFVGGIIGVWEDNDNREVNSKIMNTYSEGDVIGEDQVGGIAGLLINIDVSNSNSEGLISGSRNIGGIVGRYSEATIESSESIGKIIGEDNVGGILGFGYGLIIDSYSQAEILGNNKVGGLAGELSGNIIRSYSSGSISGGGKKIGGLVGELRYNTSHSIEESFSISNVAGLEEVGGLVGDNNGSEIINSYSHGNVDGETSVGGLVGVNRNEGTIKNSYSKGIVNGSIDIGGVVGTNGAIIKSTYWDSETSNRSNAVGRGNSDGAIGLTASEMNGEIAETKMPNLDWSEIWRTSNDYPVLYWE